MTLCDEDAKVEPERDSDAQSVTLGEPLLVTLPEGLREPAVVSEYEGELVAVREREAQGVGDVEGLMVRDTVPLTVREPVEERLGVLVANGDNEIEDVWEMERDARALSVIEGQLLADNVQRGEPEDDRVPDPHADSEGVAELEMVEDAQRDPVLDTEVERVPELQWVTEAVAEVDTVEEAHRDGVLVTEGDGDAELEKVPVTVPQEVGVAEEQWDAVREAVMEEDADSHTVTVTNGLVAEDVIETLNVTESEGVRELEGVAVTQGDRVLLTVGVVESL